jgi:cation transport protein ChaC
MTTGFKLTRESILDGSMRALSRGLNGPGGRYMSDAERGADIIRMLGQAPAPNRIWVFAYGSLIWNPAIHYVERRTARVHGYHRQFCLWSRAGRGSPDRPGLMLGIEPGGSCHGVIYRLAPHQIYSELDVVWRREMGTMAYRPVWIAARTPQGIEHAIAFAVNRAHERYIADLDLAATARYLASGAGPLGRCRDYLYETVTHLRALGLRDRHLELLESRVREHAGAKR